MAGAGTEEQGFTTLRYGGQFDEDTHYRAYVKYFNRDSQDFIGGGDAADDWQVGQSGFRIDWQPEGPDSVTVQGDIYRGVVGTTGSVASPGPPFQQTLNSDDDIFGANLLSRWTHQFDNGSDMALQVYYDLAEAEELGVDVAEHTFDVDFQHHVQMLDRHDIVWGVGSRLIQGEFDGTFTTDFSKLERTDYLLSAFLQDEITLVPRRTAAHSRFEVRVQQLHGIRISADGPVDLDARRPPSRLGRHIACDPHAVAVGRQHQHQFCPGAR